VHDGTASYCRCVWLNRILLRCTASGAYT
jgi:hypothetical protein